MHTDTCHGTLASGPSPAANGTHYIYCTTCQAYTYYDVEGHEDMPQGTDRAVNQAAWDDGYLASPDA